MSNKKGGKPAAEQAIAKTNTKVRIGYRVLKPIEWDGVKYVPGEVFNPDEHDVSERKIVVLINARKLGRIAIVDKKGDDVSLNKVRIA